MTELEDLSEMGWNELRNVAKEKGVDVYQRGRDEIEVDLRSKLEDEGMGSEVSEDDSVENDGVEENDDVEDNDEDLSTSDAEEPKLGFEDITGDEPDEEGSEDEGMGSDGSEGEIDKSKGNPLADRSAREEFGSDLNNALAEIFSSDLEGDEKEKVKNNLREKYDSFSFAQNGLWYFEEEIMSDDKEFGSKEAFLISGLMMLGATISERPDLPKKALSKAKSSGSSNQEQTSEGDE